MPSDRTSRNGSELVDRLPPHSQESEQAILGCCLLSPRENIATCIESFSNPEVFYDLRHRSLYNVMVEMWNDQDPIDVITVMERLKVYGLLEQIGGIGYLAALPDVPTTSSNADFYIKIVRDKYLLRSMMRVCVNVVSIIYDNEGRLKTEEILDEAERDVLKVNENRSKQTIVPVMQLVRESITEIESASERGGVITGLATGFIDLDRLTNGMKPQEMIVIAARPAIGKTSLAMNIVETVCVTNKIPVGVFSLEMSASALITRMLCSRARVNIRNVRDGFLAERDFPKLTNAAGSISSAPLYIDDTGGMSILQLRAKARRMWQQYGIKLFVIDYLQLLNALGGSRRQESRQQEVADISAGIKNLAKELKVPVIALSQLNREIEREKSRKPRMADLRESGAIENDADFIGFLYKPKTENEETVEDYEDSIPINLLIGKQRSGPAGVDVALTFLKAYTRFESAARISTEDVSREQNLPYNDK